MSVLPVAAYSVTDSKNIRKPDLSKFGCRMTAVVGSSEESQESGEDEVVIGRRQLREEILLRHLANQVIAYHDTGRDGKITPFCTEDFTYSSAARNQTNGHGFVAYQDANLKTDYHSTTPLGEARNGDIHVAKDTARNFKETLKGDPSNILTHIRFSTDKAANICNENVHPFIEKDFLGKTWSFAHNGINAARHPDYQRLVRTTLGREMRGNMTDSEATFLVLLANMKRFAKKHHKKELSHDDVAQVFAQTIRDIHAKGGNRFSEVKAEDSNPQAHMLGMGGRIQSAPSGAYIFTNGQSTYALVIRRNLYLGRVDYTNGKTDFFLTSEWPKDMKRFLEEKNMRGIIRDYRWSNLVRDNLLSFERQPDGTLKTQYIPVETLIPSSQAMAQVKNVLHQIRNQSSLWWYQMKECLGGSNSPL
jgi:predicted glutamine amidotransferase